MSNFGIKNIWKDTNTGTQVDTSNLVTLDGNQTITGVKTFSALPVSSVAPTTDTQLANKRYVDSRLGGTFQKLGFVQSGHIEPNQTTTAQVFDFSNYDLSNGIFSFTVKTGISGNDMSFGFYGVQITDNNSYSVITNAVKVYNAGNDKAFDLKIQRTTNHQIKLWFTNLVGGGFTVSYWGVLVKREGDLVSLTG